MNENLPSFTFIDVVSFCNVFLLLFHFAKSFLLAFFILFVNIKANCVLVWKFISILASSFVWMAIFLWGQNDGQVPVHVADYWFLFSLLFLFYYLIFLLFRFSEYSQRFDLKDKAWSWLAGWLIIRFALKF